MVSRVGVDLLLDLLEIGCTVVIIILLYLFLVYNSTCSLPR
jgi:hypothetical protein